MNPDAGVPRREFDTTVGLLMGRLAALEKALEGALPRSADESVPRAGEKPKEPEADVVRRREFELFKWMGAFALTAMISGFGFLYLQTADLRIAIGQVLTEMERQHADIRKEMQEEHAAIRKEMQEEHAAIRVEVGDIRERVVRIEALMPRQSERNEDP